MTSAFCRYDLRTTDAEAARAFYADAVGLDLPSGAEPSELPFAVWPLHEQARARGAPAHWLGQIGVPDLEAAVSRLVELGGERLGPTVRAPDGTLYATLRDPAGAVVALRGSLKRPERVPVAWHQLNTRDVNQAWAVYSELCGWASTETFETPGLEGGYRLFAWDATGPSVGAMANTAQRPEIHTHWLYFFPVTDLAERAARVRAQGGQVLGSPVGLPNGDSLLPCQDPQGAAFGMFQARSRV